MPIVFRTMAKGKKPDPAAPDLSYITESLRPLAVLVSSIDLDPVNARKHPEANMSALRGSLRTFGQRKPVVVNKRTGTVEAGNGTLAAARELGWSHVAAVFVDDDPTTAAGFALTDNRSAELAEWAEPELKALLETVSTTDPDLMQMLDTLATEQGIVPAVDEQEEGGAEVIPEKFQILIEFETESKQAEWLEKLTAEGLNVRSLIS